MWGLLLFLLSNWAWITTLIALIAGFVFYVFLGRTLLGLALFGVAAFLALFVIYDAFQDYTDGIREEERLACFHRGLQAELIARAMIRGMETAAYERGIAAEKARQEADAADAEKTEDVIREAIKASLSAQKCVLDPGTASALNSLRDGQ